MSYPQRPRSAGVVVPTPRFVTPTTTPTVRPPVFDGPTPTPGRPATLAGRLEQDVSRALRATSPSAQPSGREAEGGPAGVSNQEAANIGRGAAIGSGIAAAAAVTNALSAGAISADDINQLTRAANEAVGIVSRAPGATTPAGPGIGISDQGATNLGRAFSVPFATIIGAVLPETARSLSTPATAAARELTNGLRDISPVLGRELGTGLGNGLAPAGEAVARELGNGANTAVQSAGNFLLAGAVLLTVGIMLSVAVGVAAGIGVSKLLTSRGTR